MTRWLLRLLAGALLLGGVALPAVQQPSSASDPVAEETTITQYVATFDIDEDGDLAATEQLTVNFPFGGKHGIFRFWDLHDANDPNARRRPEAISVTRDGQPDEVLITRNDRGRYVTARIGSPDVTLQPGPHTYVITYEIDGVLIPRSGEIPTQFYWNVIPGGWQQQIEASDIVVNLPTAAIAVQCAVGVGATGGCQAEGQGTTTLRIRTGFLAPRTPVTISAGMQMPTPTAGNRLPWAARLDPILGSSQVALLLVAAATIATGAYATVLGRSSREAAPGFPLQYAPPPGIGPAQANYVLTETIGKESFVATMLYAAERGAVVLDKVPSGWSITDKSGNAGWAGVDEVTLGMAALLSGPYSTFTAFNKDVSSGERLKNQLAKLTSDTRHWAGNAGLVVSERRIQLGGALVIVCAVIAGVICVWRPLGMTALALVPGVFAIGGARMLGTGATTRRTAAGRALWSRVGGFHRVLSTPSSIERFEFSGRQELYTAYLPWAVAFGCAGEWADKYQTEMGTAPPMPLYVGHGFANGNMQRFADTVVQDFSSTLDSAISSYEASQSSSSSGGGDFSGGGGGGGGGGGSW
ncbi:MAG: DUF2207 domain-containing protein [Actinomycetota bacterium]|nr:DUF2207 domain-containing protein [Actinomycetota bacterium]